MICNGVLVSVIIPLYNRENTIQRAVDSVLNQTYSNIEVLVVDDGSTDNSVEMLKKYHNDNRVKIFCQESNQGANAARNRGIREAKGEYIAFHDSDDAWVPDKLEKQLKCMETENYDVCFSSFKRFFTNSSQIVPDISEQLSSTVVRERLKAGNVVGTPTLVIHRDVVKTVGMFDEEMPRLQDYEFAIRIAKKFDFGFVNEPLVIEYQTEGCISLNQESLHRAYALLLKKHSDFLNIEYIWGEYLKTGNEVTNRDIDWSELDKAIVNITDGNSNCSNVRLYKITAQCFNERYLRLKQLEEQKYNLLLKELENKRFVVFGAGYFSRQLMDELNRKNLVPQCILVTEKDGTDYLNNIPVKRLTEWTDIEDVVIIAVSGNAQTEIITSLLKCGFSQYYIYPECI